MGVSTLPKPSPILRPTKDVGVKPLSRQKGAAVAQEVEWVGW